MSTMALNYATFAYVKELSDHVLEDACQRDSGLAHGLNVIRRRVTHRCVAEAMGQKFHPLPFDANHQ